MATTGRIEQRLGRRAADAPVSDVAVTVLASVSIALPLLFYLHQHVQMLRYGYEIEALRQQRAELLDQQRELAADEARSASLSRVEEQARLLGLGAPRPTDVYAGQGGPAPAPAKRAHGRASP